MGKKYYFDMTQQGHDVSYEDFLKTQQNCIYIEIEQPKADEIHLIFEPFIKNYNFFSQLKNNERTENEKDKFVLWHLLNETVYVFEGLDSNIEAITFDQQQPVFTFRNPNSNNNTQPKVKTYSFTEIDYGKACQSSGLRENIVKKFLKMWMNKPNYDHDAKIKENFSYVRHVFDVMPWYVINDEENHVGKSIIIQLLSKKYLAHQKISDRINVDAEIIDKIGFLGALRIKLWNSLHGFPDFYSPIAFKCHLENDSFKLSHHENNFKGKQNYPSDQNGFYFLNVALGRDIGWTKQNSDDLYFYHTHSKTMFTIKQYKSLCGRSDMAFVFNMEGKMVERIKDLQVVEEKIPELALEEYAVKNFNDIFFGKFCLRGINSRWVKNKSESFKEIIEKIDWNKLKDERSNNNNNSTHTETEEFCLTFGLRRNYNTEYEEKYGSGIALEIAVIKTLTNGLLPHFMQRSEEIANKFNKFYREPLLERLKEKTNHETSVWQSTQPSDVKTVIEKAGNRTNHFLESIGCKVSPQAKTYVKVVEAMRMIDLLEKEVTFDTKGNAIPPDDHWKKIVTYRDQDNFQNNSGKQEEPTDKESKAIEHFSQNFRNPVFAQLQNKKKGAFGFLKERLGPQSYWVGNQAEAIEQIVRQYLSGEKSSEGKRTYEIFVALDFKVNPNDIDCYGEFIATCKAMNTFLSEKLKQEIQFEGETFNLKKEFVEFRNSTLNSYH